MIEVRIPDFYALSSSIFGDVKLSFLQSKRRTGTFNFRLSDKLHHCCNRMCIGYSCSFSMLMLQLMFYRFFALFAIAEKIDFVTLCFNAGCG